MPSLLSPSDVSAIAAIRADGFATRKALASPPVNLVLERWNATTEAWDVLPAQLVLVTPSRNESSTVRDEGASGTYGEGILEKETPFDVQVGDQFTLGLMAARVTVVPFVQYGIVRAEYVMLTDRGEA